ncbi:hypothetical protein [Encephalitozoon cuniculi GB-M1]|uniref:Uncharacterized protein n=1 Tax=Encephalitozoon cuniculi (strain GB-M1) TaxID=284813 RepID=Q8SUG6_ENCCU|nr:uncharacterized protein ECU10_0430 [Encephalitozoon cuniculi GB-M1]CAD25762.1 hypothetical protein [Encephalitozoon cuniculi GB-M1]
MGDEWKNLKIEHSLDCKRTLELEKMIKLHIRQNSLNLPTKNEVERYSDKRFRNLLSESTLKETVSAELMPPEISRMFGRKEKEIEDIERIESSAEEEPDETDEIKDSSDVENDYVDNFYEEDDELTAEKDEEAFF